VVVYYKACVPRHEVRSRAKEAEQVALLMMESKSVASVQTSEVEVSEDHQAGVCVSIVFLSSLEETLSYPAI